MKTTHFLQYTMYKASLVAPDTRPADRPSPLTINVHTKTYLALTCIFITKCIIL